LFKFISRDRNWRYQHYHHAAICELGKYKYTEPTQVFRPVTGRELVLSVKDERDFDG